MEDWNPSLDLDKSAINPFDELRKLLNNCLNTEVVIDCKIFNF
jgi:hypothetical protein